MDIFQMTQEFNWLRQVLLSSKTDIHLKCCNNLFNNFLNKWRFEMSEDLKITLSNDFRFNLEKKIKKIKKMVL